MRHVKVIFLELYILQICALNILIVCNYIYAELNSRFSLCANPKPETCNQVVFVGCYQSQIVSTSLQYKTVRQYSLLKWFKFCHTQAFYYLLSYSFGFAHFCSAILFICVFFCLWQIVFSLTIVHHVCPLVLMDSCLIRNHITSLSFGFIDSFPIGNYIFL